MEQEKLQYEQAALSVKNEIHQVLKNTPAVISDITETLSLSTGKGIRGDLAILSSCDADHMTGIPAIKIAAAVELLHLATLVHDDVIDDAEMRRGKPSLYRQFGKKNAVLSGDYLFCVCFSLISEAYSHDSSDRYIDRISDFSRAMSYICLGEILQHKNNFNFGLRTKDYLKIINGKTTTLFALSMYAGARAGDLPHEQAKIYGLIGKCIGSVFQLIDDCIDYEMNLAIANKPVVQDLKAGVITLPLIFAMSRDKSFHKMVEGINHSAQIEGEASIYQNIALKVKALGGIQYTRLIAKRYLEKALKLTDKIDDEFKRRHLKELLNNIYEREI